MTRPVWSAAQHAKVGAKIGVVGAGELGLRIAVAFAERGHEVVCANLGADAEAPRPAAALRRNARFGHLRVTSSGAEAARHGAVIIMAFGSRELGAPRDDDAGISAAAAIEVARSLAGPAVIVDRCTKSEAAAERIARLMARHSHHEIVVVSRAGADGSGSAVRVFMRPD